MSYLIAALEAIKAGGYWFINLFSGSRRETSESQAEFHEGDAERRGLIGSESLTTESEVENEDDDPVEHRYEGLVCICSLQEFLIPLMTYAQAKNVVSFSPLCSLFIYLFIYLFSFVFCAVGSLEQLPFKGGDSVEPSNSLMEKEVNIEAPFLPVHEKKPKSGIESDSVLQSELDEKPSAEVCTENSQPPDDTHEKSKECSAQVSPVASPAAKHDAYMSPVVQASHYSSPPPTAPRPKPKPSAQTRTLEEGMFSPVPTGVATSPKENLQVEDSPRGRFNSAPNAVLVMPKGLAERIAHRSPGGVGGGDSNGDAEDSLSSAKISRRLTAPVVRPRKGRGDIEEEAAVSFDKVCNTW